MKHQTEKTKHVSGNCRISVTLEPEQYEQLQRISGQKRVSLAWVVRDAVEKMLKEEAPLFGGLGRSSSEESKAGSARG